MNWFSERSKSARTIAPDHFQFHAATILYVEDNPANMRLMEMIVGRIDALSLLTAYTAESGIKAARARRPDLILMDINLPDMSGIDALKILRRDAETREISVIAVSANAMSHDIAIAEQASFDAYITKPFEIADVRATITQTLGPGHATPESDAVPGLPVVERAKNYPPLEKEDIRILFSAAEALPSEFLYVLQNQASEILAQIGEICQAVMENDPGAAEIAAHNLKIGSGTFGARGLWLYAQKIETFAGWSDLAAAKSLVSGLRKEHDEVAPAIARLLADTAIDYTMITGPATLDHETKADLAASVSLVSETNR